eukprot:358531-Chlamydomonas_euryale.AAC.7
MFPRTGTEAAIREMRKAAAALAALHQHAWDALDEARTGGEGARKIISVCVCWGGVGALRQDVWDPLNEAHAGGPTVSLSVSLPA